MCWNQYRRRQSSTMKPTTTEDPLQQKQDNDVEKVNLKGDRLNVVLLIILYILQGLPSGLSHAIPFVLQSRNVTYSQQAGFSFAHYAFCFKLLWAPIVDCVYWKRFGRRKTWLIPTQYLMGICLLLISFNVDEWLGDAEGRRPPNIQMLTVTLFFCIFLAATQDIAVDGWSLTMLQRKNVGHSATCNSIGWYIGQFFGYVLFIILDSSEFCNKFRSVPQDHGFITFADFMYAWGVIFILTTTLVWIFKRENSQEIIDNEAEINLNLVESYKLLWKILQIKPIQMLCIIFLTCRVGFGTPYKVAPLKLVDVGVPADTFALLTIPLIPFQIILPFVLNRHMSGPRCMRTFLATMVFKIILSIIMAAFVYYTTYFMAGDLPFWHYSLLMFIMSVDTMSSFFLSVTQQAFFARVSDSRFGGIYLTLLNTMCNIGSSWPSSLALWLVDPLTINWCSRDKFSCYKIDGYYIEVVLGTVLFIIWLCWGKKEIIRLENLDLSAWRAEHKSSSIKNDLLLKNENCSV